jgi:3-dehydroquinate dehydratase-2
MHIQRNGDRRHHIAVIDGPNMSNLGARNKKVFGSIASLDHLKSYVAEFGAHLGVEVESFSSNYEGAILEYIHESARRVDAYIINPAGLTATGGAVRHALHETERPVMEVHFANRAAASHPVPSAFTHTATGLCMGMRQYSYVAALVALTLALDDENFLGAPPA